MRTDEDSSSRIPASLARAGITMSGILLSYWLCLVAMRTAVGPFPGGLFGLSDANRPFSLGVGSCVGIVTAVATGVVFSEKSTRRRWLSVACAALIPAVCSFGFFLAVVASLG